MIHLHPSYSIAFTAFGRELPLFTASARLKLGRVPTIASGRPGSPELAEKARETLRQNQESSAFLMKAHGILVVGKNIKDCFETAELLEDTAKIGVLISLYRPGDEWKSR